MTCSQIRVVIKKFSFSHKPDHFYCEARFLFPLCNGPQHPLSFQTVGRGANEYLALLNLVQRVDASEFQSSLEGGKR